MGHLNVNDILITTARYREEQEISYHIARKVCDFIKEKWHNKKINKRLAADVLKLLNGEFFGVYYEARYGMFHLKIERKDGRAKLSMLICYDSNTIIDAEKVEDYNRCYLLNAERNKDIDDRLFYIPAAVIRYNKAIEELESIRKLFEGSPGGVYPIYSYFDFKPSEEVKIDQ